MPRTSPLIRAFVNYLVVERGLSRNTVKSYLADLMRLQIWAAENHLNIRGLTARDIARHIGNLSRANLNPTSINRAISTVRNFYAFLNNEAELPTNPALDIDSFRALRPLPHVLTVGQVRRLLNSPDLTSVNGLRDRALLEILFAAGLRISEATHLLHRDVALDRRILQCFGKGDKERQVPFSKSAAESIRAYISALYPRTPPKAQTSIFLNQSRPLTRQFAWSIIKRHAANAGVATIITPHSLRHTFATTLLNNGVPTRTVQQLLGHSHISTTEIYLSVCKARLRETYDRCHPRATAAASALSILQSYEESYEKVHRQA